MDERRRVTDLKISRTALVEAEKVLVEGAENVTVRWLISEKDGANNFYMRLFEIGPGGRTPLHSHGIEHEVYILSGEGKLVYEGSERTFSAGHFIFVPGNREHSFINTGGGALEFLCIIPSGNRTG